MLKLLLPLVLATLALPASAQNTWTIDYGDPAGTGTATTHIEVAYYDGQGKLQKKTIGAACSFNPSFTPAMKREAMQSAISAAANDPANTVGGQPLIDTAGLGDVMNVAPHGDNPSHFTEAKVKKVSTSDQKTGETDSITKPAGSGPGLGAVGVDGNVRGFAAATTGMQSRDPQALHWQSHFYVQTNMGSIDVPLHNGMSRLALLEEVRAGIVSLGGVAWLDTDREVVLVLLDGAPMKSLGAGSTDDLCAATVDVLAP